MTVGVSVLAIGSAWHAVHSSMPVVAARARIAADDPGIVPARLSVLKDGGLASAIVRLLPRPRRHSQRLALADGLLRLARDRGPSDDSARAAGVAEVLAGRCAAAARAFERVGHRTPADWNDLAAAEICTAEHEQDPGRWIAALTAADRASSADPHSAAAAFNWAVITDAMGVIPVARDAWSRSLAIDDSSPWSLLARERKGAALAQSDAEQWRRRTAQIDGLPAAEVERLAQLFPQDARRSADALYLSAWAEAMRAGRTAEAVRKLRVVRIIARTLQPQEPFLADAVAAIDRVAADPARLARMIDAQLAYYAGRIALHRTEAAKAEPELRRAAVLFASDDPPMAALARFWIASALTERNRIGEASEILTSLLAAQRASGDRYPSIAGHAAYQLSVTEAARGNWSASLTAAQRAKAAFERLGERGNVANADAVLSEDYDLLGEPLLATLVAVTASPRSGARSAPGRSTVPARRLRVFAAPNCERGSGTVPSPSCAWSSGSRPLPRT